MQQLDAFSISIRLDSIEAVVARAAWMANALQLDLQDPGLGADVWFAVLPHPKGAIQLHYDWLAECFWLTPTGELATQEPEWQRLLQQLASAE